MEDSANSVSSAESSIIITESFTSEEEFDGFAIDDTETNVKEHPRNILPCYATAGQYQYHVL